MKKSVVFKWAATKAFLLGVFVLLSLPGAMALGDDKTPGGANGAMVDGTFYTFDQLVAKAKAVESLSVASQDPAAIVQLGSGVTENPVIVWVPKSPLVFGTALNTTDHLNAVTYDPDDIGTDGQPKPAAIPLPGTFVYSPEAGAVLAPGDHSLSLVFIPEDFGMYRIVTANRTAVVNKMDPVIIWKDTTIDYGMPLHTGILNATAYDPKDIDPGGNPLPGATMLAGSFAYLPKAGTWLNAGSNSVQAVFTPVRDDVAQKTTTITITVNKVTPNIGWPTPTARVYEFELTLGSTPLNATATYNRYDTDSNGALVATPIATPVDGDIVYSASGVVGPLANGQRLNAGSYVLTVDLTPNDTTDFNPATATHPFSISQKPVVVSFDLASLYLTTDAPVQLTATTDANPLAPNGDVVPLPITFAMTPPVTWAQVTSSGSLTFPGWTTPDLDPVKSFTVTASFAGTSNYEAAVGKSATANLKKAERIIVLNPAPTDLKWGCNSVTYDLPLLDKDGVRPIWSVISGPGMITPPGSSTLLITGAGKITVQADVAADPLHNAASAQIAIHVAKGTPVFVWTQPPAPTSLTYGDNLSTVLVATATCPDQPGVVVPGIWTYYNGTDVVTPTTILPFGDYYLTAVWVTTDVTPYGENWNPGSVGPLSITVVKMVPVLIWKDATIDYGMPLHNGILNAVAYDPKALDPGGNPLPGALPLDGSFIYVPKLGTWLDAGPNPVSVTYSPLAARVNDIAQQTKAITVTVNKVVPDIVWPTPAPQVYEFELTLGSAPLDASATYKRYDVDLNGDLIVTPVVTYLKMTEFAYSASGVAGPLANGQRLNADSYVLTADLTPSLNPNFMPASATHPFTINKRPVIVSFDLASLYLTTDAPVLTATTDANPLAPNGDAVPLPLTFAVAPAVAWAQVTSSGSLTLPGWIPDADAIKPFSVTVSFAGSANYLAANANDTADLEKAVRPVAFAAVPELTWACNTVTYNLALLDENLLNPTWSVVSGPGVITPPGSSVLTIIGAGKVTVKADVAEDRIYKAAAETLLPINVAKGTPDIAWPLVSHNLTYGDTLAGMLNAKAYCPDIPAQEVPGTWTYKQNNGDVVTPGTILDVGQYVLTATFVPTADNNWNSVSIDSTPITVGKCAVVLNPGAAIAPITWYRHEGKAVEDSFPADVPLHVTSTGSQPILFELIGGVGSFVDPSPVVNGNTNLRFGNGSAPGDFLIRVSQPGNSNYEDATPVEIPVKVLKSRPLLLFNGYVTTPYGAPIEKWFAEQFEAREIIVRDANGTVGGPFYLARVKANPLPVPPVPPVTDPFLELQEVDTADWNAGKLTFTGRPIPPAVPPAPPFILPDEEPFFAEYLNYPVSKRYLDTSDSRYFTVILIAENYNYYLSVSRVGRVAVEAAPTTLTWNASASLVYEQPLGNLFGTTAKLAFDWTTYNLFSQSKPFTTKSIELLGTAPAGDVFGDRGDLTFSVDSGPPLTEAEFNAKILNVGPHSIKVTFTPGDAVIPEAEFDTSEDIYFNAINFKPSTITLSVTITPKQLLIQDFADLPDSYTTSPDICLADYGAKLNADPILSGGLGVIFAITQGVGCVTPPTGPGSCISMVGWTPDADIQKTIVVTATANEQIPVNPNYIAAAPVSRSFVLHKVAQGISCDPSSVVKTYQDPDFTVTSTLSQLDGPHALEPAYGTATTFSVAGGDAVVKVVDAALNPATFKVIAFGSDTIRCVAGGSMKFLPTAVPGTCAVTVNKANIVGVTWDPADMTYPEQINCTGNQFNAIPPAEIRGTFAYTPVVPPAITPSAGPLQLNAVFTADDPNYNPLPLGRVITVHKGTPVIAWAKPLPPITYRDPLNLQGSNGASASSPTSACSLASVPVAGNYVYTPADGTILEPGVDQPLRVTFTPLDGDNYNPAIDSNTITVNMQQLYVDFYQARIGKKYDPENDPELEQMEPLDARPFVLNPDGTPNYKEMDGTDIKLNVPVTFSITSGLSVAKIGRLNPDVAHPFIEDPNGSIALFMQRGNVKIKASTMNTSRYHAAVEVSPYVLVWSTPVVKIPVRYVWDWKNAGTTDDWIRVMAPLTANELNAQVTYIDQYGAVVPCPGSHVYLPDAGAFFSETGANVVQWNFVPDALSRFTARTETKHVDVKAAGSLSEAYDMWVEVNGLPIGFDGMQQAVSGNGVQNVLCFAFGIDPRDPGQFPMTTVSYVNGKARITYQEALAAQGFVTYGIQGSSNLGGFTGLSGADVSEISRVNLGTVEEVTVEIQPPAYRFFRISVSY